jgi:serine/threonine-protein kinase
MQRYEIIEKDTGQGGFGKIDKAFDTALERHVAIKTLDPLFKDNPSGEDIERFKREAKTLASLSHPNIPAIFDVIFAESGGEFKIIFEWIQGTNARKSLAAHGVWSIEEVRRWFGNVCSALEHAHSKNIIHRDIKPSNLIITENKESCYVVDFGIALRTADIERLTHNGSPIGTPGYMSPEQERGEELDPSSDIFSLGIVLYECLCGNRPTVGEYKQLNDINEVIPPAVDNLIQECLQEKDKRVKSASQFIDMLNQALRPSTNLSIILTDGPLHEIQIALSEMNELEYMSLPSGQRRLIFSRLKDLISVDKEHMRNAVASLMGEFIRLSHQDNPKYYDNICQHAFNYGYCLEYSERWRGNRQIRENLNEVGKYCTSEAHRIISETLNKFLPETNLEEQEGWFYHDIRVLLQNLLANPHCSDASAESLGDMLDRINELSH